MPDETRQALPDQGWRDGESLGEFMSRRNRSALETERDRLRAEVEALKAERGTLLEAVQFALTALSAFSNHRHMGSACGRDLCSLCAIEAALKAAVASDEQQLPNWWCGHCGRRRTVVERPDCPGCGHREFVNRPAGEWPNGTAASHPTPEEGTDA